jgi:hypothetical protein
MCVANGNEGTQGIGAPADARVHRSHISISIAMTLLLLLLLLCCRVIVVGVV